MTPPSLKLRLAGKSQVPKHGYWLLVMVLLLLSLVPLPAQQQVPFVTCTDDPVNCTLDNLLEVPVRIFNFLLGMAAAVLLVVIVWAGLRMILYHTSEMPEAELTNAKMTLQRGIFGFIIIAFSYLLVNLVLSLLGLYSRSAVGEILKDFGL